MGIYFDPPLKHEETKREWLRANARRPTVEELQHSGTASQPDDVLLFYGDSPWGGNIAIGYTPEECRRLIESGVFSSIWLLPRETLKSLGALGV